MTGAHEVNVATQAGPAGMSATTAWCSCGWHSPRSYATRAEGRAIAEQHIADQPRCKCSRDCEMPCWQRVGLTDQPCCDGCPPLPCYEPCSICDGGAAS